MAENKIPLDAQKAISEIERMIYAMTWESELNDLWRYCDSLPRGTATLALMGVAVRSILGTKDACEELEQEVEKLSASVENALLKLEVLFCRRRKSWRK